MGPIRETGFVNSRSLSRVARFPARETGPSPCCLKAPVIDVDGPRRRTSCPEWSKVTAPKLAVMRFPSMDKAFPERETPRTSLVFKLPSFVMPDPEA